MSAVICGYCGERFAENQGQPACAACPLKGGCRYVRCPRCGYENPCEPPWVGKLRAWLKTDDARAAGYGETQYPQDAREAKRAR